MEEPIFPVSYKFWLFREKVEYQKSTHPYIRYAPG